MPGRTSLDFDPIDEADRPYLELVRPGIAEVTEHLPKEAGSWGGLSSHMQTPLRAK